MLTDVVFDDHLHAFELQVGATISVTAEARPVDVLLELTNGHVASLTLNSGYTSTWIA